MGNRNSNETKKEYFNLINQNMRTALHTNYYSKQNQFISIIKKDFKPAIISGNQFSIENNNIIGYIFWKNYLLCYLKDLKEKGIKWGESLFNQLKQISFSNEYYFKSDFFYNEFKISTCPKNIRTMKDGQKKANENDNLNYCWNENFNLNLSSNFVGSFISLYSDSLHASDDPSTQYRKNRSKINEYLQVFKKHIFNEAHPINIIIKKFCHYFEIYVDEYIKSNEITNEEIRKDDPIITGLQNFIVEMQIVLKLFYSRTISLANFKDEKDQMINLLSSLVFNTGNLYSKLYRYFQLKLTNTNQIFKEKLDSFKDIHPEDLKIKKQFCLNEITEMYQKELSSKHEKDKITLVLKDKESGFFENNNTPKKGVNISDIVVSSESSKLLQITEKSFQDHNNVIKTNLNNEPYFNVIQLLRTVTQYHVPFEKMLIIATMSAQITKCVNDFWDKNSELMTKSLLNIDADELMSIFIYLIIKAQIPDLFIHTSFIKYFTTTATKSTMMGYYFTTLEGSMDFLIKQTDLSIFTKIDN